MKDRYKSHLCWVDEYFAKVKPFVAIRRDDNLLIKRPNKAVKLNSVGAQILEKIIAGKAVLDLLEPIANDDEKVLQIVNFLYAVRHQIDGELTTFSVNPAVEVKPLEKVFSPLPVLSEFALLDDCNLACRFCYGACSFSKKKRYTQLSLDEMKIIIKKIHNEAKIPSISFTGGEPTLSPNLPAVIEFAKSFDMRVNLITNGTLLTFDLVQKLKTAGLDSAQISLEGVTSETHDAITQVAGSFDKTVNGLKNALASGLHAHCNTTLNRMNIHEATAFPEFVKDLGAERFSMNMVIPTGSVEDNRDISLSYSEIGPIVLDVLKQAKKSDVEFMWYSPVPVCMFNSILEGLGNKGCSACDGLLSVNAKGEVIPCASYDKPLGSLLNGSFTGIWNSEISKRIREKELAHIECTSCDSFNVCHGACPIYWKHFGFDELCEHRSFSCHSCGSEREVLI